MPPSVVAGVRAATLGAGGTTVLATVFVAALGIVGALGFAASEDRLATDPALWGWTFDAVVGDGNDETALERAEETLAGNPMIESYAARIGVDSVTLQLGATRRSTPGRRPSSTSRERSSPASSRATLPGPTTRSPSAEPRPTGSASASATRSRSMPATSPGPSR